MSSTKYAKSFRKLPKQCFVEVKRPVAAIFAIIYNTFGRFFPQNGWLAPWRAGWLPGWLPGPQNAGWLAPWVAAWPQKRWLAGSKNSRISQTDGPGDILQGLQRLLIVHKGLHTEIAYTDCIYGLIERLHTWIAYKD